MNINTKKRVDNPAFQPCEICQSLIKISTIICPHCHYAQGLCALSGFAPKENIKNQYVIFWISLLFGGLGIHRFLMGEYVKGCCYLLFCWTLVPIFIGWRDAFRTLKMDPVIFISKRSEYARFSASQKNKCK